MIPIPPGMQSVLETSVTVTFVYAAVLATIRAGYQRESKRYLTLAVGCTGGKHSSVVMAQELADRLAATGVRATVVHRDLGRE